MADKGIETVYQPSYVNSWALVVGINDATRRERSTLRTGGDASLHMFLMASPTRHRSAPDQTGWLLGDLLPVFLIPWPRHRSC